MFYINEYTRGIITDFIEKGAQGRDSYDVAVSIDASHPHLHRARTGKGSCVSVDMLIDLAKDNPSVYGSTDFECLTEDYFEAMEKMLGDERIKVLELIRTMSSESNNNGINALLKAGEASDV